MTSEQRAKILELSGGLFGKSCFHPLELATEDVNKTVFTYEGDDSRGGKPGCLHRSTVKLNKTKTVRLIDDPISCCFSTTVITADDRGSGGKELRYLNGIRRTVVDSPKAIINFFRSVCQLICQALISVDLETRQKIPLIIAWDRYV